MTPSPGPIAKTQTPTSKIFQNLTPQINQTKKTNPRGSRVIPEIPLLNDLPPIVPNPFPNISSLPNLPKILLTCNPGEFPFPIDPSDMSAVNYIYRPHENLK